jgi:hypothetical protein
MAKAKTPTLPTTHHYLRTPTAGFFGMVAMVLVSASILTVWANRTLTDTNTYVQTVGPVIQRPELQEFVAQKVTDQLLESAPTADVAAQLLPADQVAGKTPEQLKLLLSPVIHDSVVQILSSPRLSEVWKSTNQSAHAEVISRLDANAPEITLDLSPLVDTVLVEMKQTKLAPVADKIDLKPSAAKIDLKGSSIEKLRTAYRSLKTGTLQLLLVTLVCLGLSVWISVHHIKTLRHILTGTGVSALLTAGLIALPSVVSLPAKNAATGRLVAALAGTLLHGLQVACLVLGVIFIAGAIGTKVYELKRR